MSMRCKQCAEAFPKGQPFDLFEFRRHKVLPSANADELTHADVIEDGGMFCSRKCLGDYLKSGERSGVFDLGGIRKRLDEQK